MTPVAQTDTVPTPALRALGRPRWLAIGCIAVLAAAGWSYLGLMLGASGVLEALCRPAFGTAGPGLAQAGLVFAMWCAMALAMMLPTAGPMILTYAEIAETAARKGEPAASPLWLIAGYVGVWLGVAALLAALQLGLARLSLLDPAMASVEPAVLRRRLHRRRPVPVLRPEARLRDAVSAAVPVLLRQLDRAGARRVPARLAPGPLLSRLLLGDDAADVRRRGDERGLDGGARDA